MILERAKQVELGEVEATEEQKSMVKIKRTSLSASFDSTENGDRRRVAFDDLALEAVGEEGLRNTDNLIYFLMGAERAAGTVGRMYGNWDYKLDLKEKSVSEEGFKIYLEGMLCADLALGNGVRVTMIIKEIARRWDIGKEKVVEAHQRVLNYARRRYNDLSNPEDRKGAEVRFGIRHRLDRGMFGLGYVWDEELGYVLMN